MQSISSDIVQGGWQNEVRDEKAKLKEKYQGQDNREMEKVDQTRDNSLVWKKGNRMAASQEEAV